MTHTIFDLTWFCHLSMCMSPKGEPPIYEKISILDFMFLFQTLNQHSDLNGLFHIVYLFNFERRTLKKFHVKRKLTVSVESCHQTKIFYNVKTNIWDGLTPAERLRLRCFMLRNFRLGHKAQRHDDMLSLSARWCRDQHWNCLSEDLSGFVIWVGLESSPFVRSKLQKSLHYKPLIWTN